MNKSLCASSHAGKSAQYTFLLLMAMALSANSQETPTSIAQFIEQYVPVEAKLKHRYQNLAMTIRTDELLPDSPKQLKELTFKSTGDFHLVDYHFFDEPRIILCSGHTSFQLVEDKDGVLTKVRDLLDGQCKQLILNLAQDATAPFTVAVGQSIVELARQKWLEIESIDLQQTANGNDLVMISWTQKHDGRMPFFQGTVTYDPSQDWQIVEKSDKVDSNAIRTEAKYSYSKIPRSPELWIHAGTFKMTKDDKITQLSRFEITQLVHTAPEKEEYDFAAITAN